MDLVVYGLCDLIAVVPLLRDLPAEEDELFPFAEGPRAQALAHAEARDHGPRDPGGLLQVVAGARRYLSLAELDLLSSPTPHGDGKLVLELAERLQVPVLLGQELRVPAHRASGDDGHLGDRVYVGQEIADEGVASLVEGCDFLLMLAYDAGPAGRPRHDAVYRFGELVEAYALLFPAGGQDSGLVDEIREVGSAESRCLPRDVTQVDVLFQRLALDVHLQNLGAPVDVRVVQHHATVKPARP